ncbi:hypothetical protein PTSG_08831 [Salpingoeca rosetta]|uniref:Uncharacterized protein n=1 Tax=Salpingoeca rosetta (strain ATCC 50818 / BSB-021) TaxID=946362 RepID=F2UKU3_SALR5|nr:uncharacterized protein PTSG_08831 [Salpingoeca rosetta]EGD77742.1 hypothetical protein PTSG_08831 [Salpingoeca rosetta]|eukprot:XP_004990218.1 hypothetical protein PTSG_08831 [Salpingoeca rosetta]
MPSTRKKKAQQRKGAKRAAATAVAATAAAADDDDDTAAVVPNTTFTVSANDVVWVKPHRSIWWPCQVQSVDADVNGTLHAAVNQLGLNKHWLVPAAAALPFDSDQAESFINTGRMRKTRDAKAKFIKAVVSANELWVQQKRSPVPAVTALLAESSDSERVQTGVSPPATNKTSSVKDSPANATQDGTGASHHANGSTRADATTALQEIRDDDDDGADDDGGDVGDANPTKKARRSSERARRNGDVAETHGDGAGAGDDADDASSGSGSVASPRRRKSAPVLLLEGFDDDDDDDGDDGDDDDDDDGREVGDGPATSGARNKDAMSDSSDDNDDDDDHVGVYDVLGLAADSDDDADESDEELSQNPLVQQRGH